jgi:hypothetical protein
MAEDDPFADLGETLGDGSDGSPEGDTTESATGDVAEDPAETRDPMTDSAFSYDVAEQRPFYARQDTIEDFDAWLKYELERELNQRGYRNIVVREMTDALLRTVVEEDLLTEVAERFERARESPDDESPE